MVLTGGGVDHRVVEDDHYLVEPREVRISFRITNGAVPPRSFCQHTELHFQHLGGGKNCTDVWREIRHSNGLHIAVIVEIICS